MFLNKKVKHLLFLLIIISLNQKSWAQPVNYWTISFNSESSLLAGAVVGGNSGITSIYYNPAGITEIEDKMLALNANLFSLTKTSYKNALGTDNNLEYLNFTVKPRFVSYLYKLPKLKNTVIQFAIFNRNIGKMNIYDNIKHDDVQLIMPEIKEQYTGYYDFSNIYQDTWGGAGFAYNFTENFVIGLSNLISYKDLKYRKIISIYVTPDVNAFPDTIAYYNANSSDYEKINMYDVRWIPKLGFRYYSKELSYGLNFTFPSVRLFGKADVTRSIANTDIRYENQPVENVFLNQSATHLLAQFKDPFSVAFGIKYTGINKLESSYLTLEYLYKIDTYKAIDGTKTTKKDKEQASDYLSYKYGAKSIFNFALGLQFIQSEKLEWLYGFRTNFNPYKVVSDSVFQDINEFFVSTSDYYHLSVGIKFIYKKLSVIMGLEYQIGISKNMPEFVNFAEPSVNLDQRLYLAGKSNENMIIRTNMLGLYLSLTFGN